MPKHNDRQLTDYLEIAKRINHDLWVSHFKAWNKRHIHQAQVFLMYYLYRHQPVTVANIAKMTGTTSSAATQLIGGLVNKRLVTRKHGGSDHRQVEISLTASGHNLYKRVKQEHLIWLKKYLSPLTGRELITLIRIQAKLLTTAAEPKHHEHHHYR